MSLTPLLAAARAAHERLLVDTCVITHPGLGPMDPATGAYLDASTQLYSGPCRVKPAAAQAGAVGDDPATVSHPTLAIAADVPAVITPGDLVSITSTNPDTDGQTMRVLGAESGSTSTARRFRLETIE